MIFKFKPGDLCEITPGSRLFKHIIGRQCTIVSRHSTQMGPYPYAEKQIVVNPPCYVVKIHGESGDYAVSEDVLRKVEPPKEEVGSWDLVPFANQIRKEKVKNEMG